jgi:amino acid permease
MLGSVLFDILEWNGDLNDFYENSFWGKTEYKPIIIYSIATLFIIFSIIFREIHKLFSVSIFCLFCMIYSISIIIIESYWYIPYYWNNTYKENDPKTWINYFDFNFLKNFDKLYFFRMIANLFFCFNFHNGFLPIINELKQKDLIKKNKVINLIIIWFTIIYLTVGILGFLSLPLNTPNVIVQRKKIFSNDWIMNIGKILIILSLLMKTPTNFVTYNSNLFFLIIFDKSEVSYKTEIIIKILSFYFVATIAFFHSYPEDYIDIIGGLCSINICLVYPCK